MDRSMKLLLFFISLVLIFSQNANAVLGQKESSVAQVATKMKAQVKAAAVNSEQWTAKDVVANGTTIREYLNADGVIFAVAWNGVIEPDLATLFGDYYQEYLQAVKATKKTAMTKRHLNIETPRVKVQRFGHMRSWHGLAYVPRLVPANVSVEELPL